MIVLSSWLMLILVIRKQENEQTLLCGCLAFSVLVLFLFLSVHKYMLY